MNSVNPFARKELRFAAAVALFAFAIPVNGQAISLFSSSLRRTPPSEISIGFSPLNSFVGVTQYVFLNGCAQREAIYYPTAYAGGTLTLQTNRMQSPCFFPIGVMQLGPPSSSALRVILNSPSGVLAEKTTQVLVPAKATVNIDGMWYDETTNGAGVSFFQSAQTGQVLGTWFLYASTAVASAQTADTPRWYSLQNTAWTNNGDTLEGTIFEAKADAGSDRIPCGAGPDCPKRYESFTPVGSFRFVVSGTNRGRIESFDTTGAVVFASNVQRLLF